MDPKPQNPELAALIRRNEAARRALTGEWQVLRRRLDIPARVTENIRNNRTVWFAGSAALGLLASSWFRRKPAAPIKAAPSRKGLLSLALGTAFTLAKPALKTMLWNEVQKRLLSRNPRPPRPANTRDFSD
jgi:hypothetical protein